MIYTKWVDILVFSFGSLSHVLQGRKNRFTGSIHFRVEGAKSTFKVADCNTLTKEDLEAVGLWNKNDQ